MAMLVSLLFIIYLCLLYERVSTSVDIQQEIYLANGNHTMLLKTTVEQWVHGPPTRGTADILWTCAVTLLACT